MTAQSQQAVTHLVSKYYTEALMKNPTDTIYTNIERAIEKVDFVSAALDGLAFARAMKEYFDNNPDGYDGLREQCDNYLQQLS